MSLHLPAQTVALPLELDARAPEIAARFVAELVRQGVTFRAHQDIGTAPSGIDSERQLTIQFLGGY